jgi:alkylation response protein AidB-like acyl-CoA dehydrogenase
MEKLPYFTEVHKDVRDIAKKVAEEFSQTASIADEREDYTIIEKNLKRLGEIGILGLRVPTEYGGQGLDMRSYALALEEIAKTCPSTALSYDAHVLAADSIMLAGNDDQKRNIFQCLLRIK